MNSWSKEVVPLLSVCCIFMFVDLGIANSEDEIKSLIEDDFKDTICNILEKYNKRYLGKDFNYWVEHTPFNHKYYDVLSHYYPDARFIHIVRDGRAVYASTIKTDFSYKDVITGAEDWKNNVEHCLALSKCYPQNITTIRYEDLTVEPEKNVRSLCEFLCMDFHESMLESKGIRKAPYAKYAKNLGKKVNSKSNDLWKRYLHRYEVEHFTVINKNLLSNFGYEVVEYSGREIKGFRKFFHKAMGLAKFIYFRKQAIRRFDNILKK